MNDEETEKHIKNYCNEYNPEKFEIVRNVAVNNNLPSIDINYLVNPNERKRTSHAFFNTYTLLIDNFESWKDFPKRSAALIATLNHKNIENKNVKYVVVPYNNVIWGVCPGNDIWYNWKKFGEITGSNQIHYWIKKLNVLYSNKNREVPFDNENYENLVKQINSLKELFMDREYTNARFNKRSPMTKFINYVNTFDKEKPLIEILEDLMNPYDNGFKVCTTKELNDLPLKEYEIWTNDKVVLKNDFSQNDFSQYILNKDIESTTINNNEIKI